MLRYLPILLLLLLLGCKPDGPQPLDLNPQQAQPTLPKLNLLIGNVSVNAELAITLQAQITGMMFRTNLPADAAMLFPIPQVGHASFWMKNTPENLDVAFIGPDGVIQEIQPLIAGTTNIVESTSANIQFSLETKAGWFAKQQIKAGTIVTTDKGSLHKLFFPNQP